MSDIVTGAFALGGVGLTLVGQFAKVRIDARQARAGRWTEGRHAAHAEFLAASNELINDIGLVAWLHLGTGGPLSPEDARHLAVLADRASNAAAALELVASDPAAGAVSDLMSEMDKLRRELLGRRDVSESQVGSLRTLRRKYLDAARSELGTRH